MAYCGVNPQGYHGINFGSFVPKPSFKARQLAASSSRRDPTLNFSADRAGEDHCFIGQQRGRYPGCSLPEIKVKRLFNKSKKKHSRSHTFDGASRERLRFPAIPTATGADTEFPVRRATQQQGGNGQLGEKRVVRNGEPWWKWSKKHHNHKHGQRLPRVENLPAKGASNRKRKHVQHNLRQRLPPLLGYRENDGYLAFSEPENNIEARTLGSKYNTYSSRNVFLNRRYYYSYSRDGIRPCRPHATVSNACLYDLSNLHSTDADYASRQEAVLSSMHNELQSVTGMLPPNGLHTRNPGSNLGAKVKQSLNRERERNHEREWKRKPVVINIDSSYVESDSEDEEVTTAPVSHSASKGLNSNHLKALAILQELINILNSSEFIPGSEYGKETSSAAEIPTLSEINIGDFFHKPESVIKQYDRFKRLTTNMNHPHSDDTFSEEQTESYNKDSHGKASFEGKDRFGLTQLLAVHSLQTSNTTLSGTDLDSAAARLTARSFGSESFGKSKSKSISERHSNTVCPDFKNTSKSGEHAEGSKDQHSGLAQLLAIQQLQALNENFSSSEVSDEPSKLVSEPSHSEEMEVEYSHFKPKRVLEKCDTQSHLVCVDLNDQYLQFSNNGFKKQLKRELTSRRLVHNASKLRLIEPAEKAQNTRPDLEISGERLKNLYRLGLLESDQDLSQLAVKANERVVVSREQLAKIKDICDHAGIGDSTIPNPETGADQVVSTMDSISDVGYVPRIDINGDNGSHGEDRDGDGIVGSFHNRTDAEQEGGRDTDARDQLEVNTLRFSRDLSWDLEAEFARVKAMDLQERLQIEQMRKEREVLDSVKRDLERFQETLNGGGSSSGTSGERPVRQRESLLPSPLPPRKKNRSARSKALKKNEQQRNAPSVSSNGLSIQSGEFERGEENDDVSEAEMEENRSACSEQQLDESGEQSFTDHPGSSSETELGEETRGEGEEIIDRNKEVLDYPTADMYPAFPGVIAEESDGYLSDSDIDEDGFSATEMQHLSQTSIVTNTGLSKSGQKKGIHMDQITMGDIAESAEYFARSEYKLDSAQEPRASTSQRTNTRGGSRPVSDTAYVESSSLTGLGTGTFSASRGGMRGSALSKSRRGKRTNSSSGYKAADIGEDTGSLSISRPQTVQQIDIEAREQKDSGGQRNRLPTRERSRMSARAQIAAADPAQVLAHHKSELAKQQLIEARKREALLVQEKEWQSQEKKRRQAEFEDRMSAAFKSEEDEIRRQRKLKAEAHKKSEELEKQRKALIVQMKKQEAQREAQERRRHTEMLEVLRQEAEKRHLQMIHEKGIIEDYQDRISTFNDWEYAYIEHYMGEEHSEKARKIDQSKKLKQEQLLHERMMEAFEFKRRELLEKLKAAQKELMMELELDKAQLDHFLKISRAFVFTYFQRVPDQTYMVPQELLM